MSNTSTVTNFCRINTTNPENHTERCIRDSKVYLPYYGLKQDLSGASRDEIIEWHNSNGSKGTDREIRGWSSQVWRYVNEIKKGDYFYICGEEKHSIRMAKVKGDYKYNLKAKPYWWRHSRNVQWFDEIKIPKKLHLKITCLPPTISFIKNEQILQRMIKIAKKLDSQTSQMPEKNSEEETHTYWEGTKKERQIKAYERKPIARQKCIEYHGSKCIICEFDFGNTYGHEYMGYIHVHHVKALSEIQEGYEVDPQKDLVPVCPNCHTVIHYKREKALTVEQVKDKIQKIKG